ncbi:MAG TPA: hypothetical protein VGX76_12935 [Pirellulales bacterium]|nr:hypothetical protein [Pirellulales bacterium]
MKESLTNDGYLQTKEKLADLERRLLEIEKRVDLSPEHLASVRRSYKMMIREYLQDIKLYEAKQRPRRDPATHNNKACTAGPPHVDDDHDLAIREERAS